MEPESKKRQQEFLKHNGFSVVPYLYIDENSDEKKIRDAIEEMDPKKFAYPADGLIMEYDDIRYRKSLGSTGHHENRLIALKWEDELFETEFLGVQLVTTRTGMISITGLFKPVSIDGTQVSRAYLHNLDIFESFEFGLGDKIRIYKANTIIPQIAENVTKSKTYNLPESCPCCSNKLTVKITSGGTPVNYSARIPIVQLSWFRSLYIFVRRPE